MMCEDCKFWDEVGSGRLGAYGKCRKNSPIRIGRDIGEVAEIAERRAVWPETLADDWCGDFQKFEE